MHEPSDIVPALLVKGGTSVPQKSLRFYGMFLWVASVTRAEVLQV